MWLVNIFKSIFSSSPIVDATLKGVDKALFTEQERAEMHRDNLKNYEAYKIAQRVLAFGFTGLYMFIFLVYVTLLIMDSAHAYQILDAVDKFYLNYIQLSIVIFYFGGGAANGVVEKIKQRLSK
jgi:hypothetical protein